MALSTFSTFFTNINTSIMDTVSTLVPEIFGLSPSLGNTIDPKYKVVIASDGGGRYRPWVIEAVLQEKVVINTESKWVELGVFQTGNDSGIIAELTSMGGVSLQSTLSSRRRWAGSSPIRITLKLRFEAEANTWSEVTKKCAKLQGLTLPSGGGVTANFLGNAKFFLTPPGPNPWNVNLPGERVMIDIGRGWLTFNNIVVDSVSTEYENRMSVDGPIGASVTINLSTYELLTKENLETAYGASVFGQVVNNTPTVLNNTANGITNFNNGSNTTLTNTTGISNVVSTTSNAIVNPTGGAVNAGVAAGRNVFQFFQGAK